jgi:pimeloyl-ACP methyl ester carboxylesterase
MNLSRRAAVTIAAVGTAAVGSAGIGAAFAARAATPAAEGAKRNHRRGYVEGSHGQIHYREHGTGPAIILMHQAPSSSLQFAPALPFFAEAGFRAIAIDYPGFGMSDPPATAPSVGDYATAVLELADALRIEGFVAIGHHTGALVANEVALRAPKRVLRLVMHGPYPANAEERQRALDNTVAREKTDVPLDDGSHFLSGWKRREAVQKPFDAAIATRAICERMMAPGPYWYGHNAAFTYDQEPALKALNVPALIIINTGDMAYAMTQRARAIRPDFAYVEMEGGSVEIAAEQPQAWVQAILPFLKG